MPRPHPLFDIYNFGDLPLLRGELLVLGGRLVDLLAGSLVTDGLALLIALQVASEVLEKSDLLLELLWVFSQGVLLANVLAIA